MNEADLRLEQPATERSPSTSIWRDSRFLRFWTSQTISHLGLQNTMMALPLLAVMSLQATPFEMGILRSLEYAPFLLFGLFAGVWADYWPKRMLLIILDFMRAAVLLSIPILFLAGSMKMIHVWMIGFTAGVLSTFYAIISQSVLPHVLSKEQFVEGNSKLELSRSLSEMTGPSIAGVLVQLLSGATAIFLYVLSFVASGLLLCTTRFEESVRGRAKGSGASIWKEIGDGFAFVFRNRQLSSIAACSSTSNFFFNMMQAILVLYVTRDIGLSPAIIGLLITLGTIGALVGSVFSGRIIRRFGMGRVIVGSAFGQGLGALLMVGAKGEQEQAFLFMLASLTVVTFCTTVYNIAQVSYRQMITSPELLGRMNATMRTIVWGVIPFGALVGGMLGNLIGLYATIVIAALGLTLSFLWVLFSPVRRVT